MSIVSAGLVLACGPSSPGTMSASGSTADTSSSSPIDHETQAGESTSYDADATTDDPSDSAGTGPVDCVPAVEVLGFQLLSDLDLGTLFVYDMDGDGADDLVGSNGIIAFNRPEGFEIEEVPGFPPMGFARPGEFGGDASPDLLVGIAGAGTQLEVHFGGGFDKSPPAETSVTPSSANSDTRDIDEDGIDDLCIVTDDGSSVEIWRGTASGVFVSDTTLDLGFPTTYIQMAKFGPMSMQLLATSGGSLRVFERVAGTEFVGTDRDYDGVGGIVWMQPVPTGASEQLAYQQWWEGGFESTYSVGFTRREGESWSSWQYPIAHANFLPPSPGDLDRDGVTDLAFARFDDGVVIELICLSEVAGFAACGSAAIEHDAQSIAILTGPTISHVAYSTMRNGAWIAPLDTILPCP